MAIINLNVFLSLSEEAAKEKIKQIYDELPYKDSSKFVTHEIIDATLKALEKQGIGPETRNKSGIDLLHYAAYTGHRELFKILIAIGFNPESIYGTTGILHNVVAGGNIELLNDVIKMNFSSYIKISNGAGLLHYAARHNKIEVFRYLISLGHDKYAKDDSGDTVLEEAVFSSHCDLVKLLIHEYGLKPSDRTRYWADSQYKINAVKYREMYYLCSHATLLNSLYCDYLNSFIFSDELEAILTVGLASDVVLNHIIPYLSVSHLDSAEQHKLEARVNAALALREKLLAPLINYCKNCSLEDEGHVVLNKLLASKMLGIATLVSNLDQSLAKLLDKGSYSLTNCLIACRANSASIAKTPLKAFPNNELLCQYQSQQIAIMQSQLEVKQQESNQLVEVEKQKNQQLIATQEQKNKISYTFQWAALSSFAALSTSLFVLGIVAMCLLQPLGVGIALTAVSTVGFLKVRSLYNKAENKTNEPLAPSNIIKS